VIIIAQRLGILNMADKVLVLDNGTINAFGNRREIAEKIRTGRTSIPVRRPRITAATRSVRRLSNKGPTGSSDASNGSVTKEKSEGAVS
jgi:ABC-type glutathione transport system ATPase component